MDIQKILKYLKDDIGLSTKKIADISNSNVKRVDRILTEKMEEAYTITKTLRASNASMRVGTGLDNEGCYDVGY